MDNVVIQLYYMDNVFTDSVGKYPLANKALSDGISSFIWKDSLTDIRSIDVTSENIESPFPFKVGGFIEYYGDQLHRSLYSITDIKYNKKKKTLNMTVASIEYEMNNEPVLSKEFKNIEGQPNIKASDIFTYIFQNSAFRFIWASIDKELDEPYKVETGSIKDAFFNALQKFGYEYFVRPLEENPSIVDEGIYVELYIEDRRGNTRGLILSENTYLESADISTSSKELCTCVMGIGNNYRQLPNNMDLSLFPDYEQVGKFIQLKATKLAALGYSRHFKKIQHFDNAGTDSGLLSQCIQYLVSNSLQDLEVNLNSYMRDISSFVAFNVGDTLKIEYNGLLYDVRCTEMTIDYAKSQSKMTSCSLSNKYFRNYLKDIVKTMSKLTNTKKIPLELISNEPLIASVTEASGVYSFPSTDGNVSTIQVVKDANGNITGFNDNGRFISFATS